RGSSVEGNTKPQAPEKFQFRSDHIEYLKNRRTPILICVSASYSVVALKIGEFADFDDFRCR
ncbi:MAG TPA: hypothetical protein VM656_01475, partial [Pyrinomonadaceae bacterium]|nr:hypothetical protein [Pyrinomonadaceae bacterium]